MAIDEPKSDRLLTLFLCGDVMTGRGIDQILPFPGNGELHEPWVKDATRYVELAEQRNGPIPLDRDFAYIWGDALQEWERRRPDLRIINLETSITAEQDYWRGKEIHYRMNPRNISCLTAARIDCCTLANNHVLDWGRTGLQETLRTLHEAGVRTTGAGSNAQQAAAPAILDLTDDVRVLVFGAGAPSSGIPWSWAAQDDRAGVRLLRDLSGDTVEQIRTAAAAFKNQQTIVVMSIHWGGNWGYEIPREHREFAHRLIDEAQVDVVHGHSSHHVKGIEVYRERLILYGCGDFLTDYEGIPGQETYRDDLGLMYFATLRSVSGGLERLQMIPTQIYRLQIRRASAADGMWLQDVLNREGKLLGTCVEPNAAGELILHWR